MNRSKRGITRSRPNSRNGLANARYIISAQPFSTFPAAVGGRSTALSPEPVGAQGDGVADKNLSLSGDGDIFPFTP
jgi:hypothetical protein